MSVLYRPVNWTPAKLVYDAVLIAAVGIYLLAYQRLGARLIGNTLPPDGPTVAMMAYGTCAFLLLTLALSIGPLAKLDARFLPLLYNRRHLGVITAIVATGHAGAVLDWYYNYSPHPELLGLLGADTPTLAALPSFFIPLGIGALLVLWVLAATSHDFWLSFLTPPVWKGIHLSIYAAYAAVVLHFSLGALQDDRGPALPAIAGFSVLIVGGLHLAAALRPVRETRISATTDGWLNAGRPDAIPDGRAVVIVAPDRRRIAVFRYEGKVAAVQNACAHQNGPLGEGRVIDGCIVCPWHGYQYRPEDGCSPPPFTERVATHDVRLENGMIFVNPVPNALGARIEPVTL